MRIAKHRPWPEVVDFYRSVVAKRPGIAPLLHLVEQIAASSYASGLYASTSMLTLLIAQLPEFGLDQEVLRIGMDSSRNELVFDFQETSSILPKYQNWIRRCSPEEGYARFVKFLKMKNWFTQYE